MTIDGVLWYLSSVAFSAAGIAPAYVLFRHLPSRGVFFARPLGLLLASLAAWLVASWTPVPWGSGLTLLSTGIACVSGAACLLRWPQLRGELRSRVGLILASESVYLGVFVAVAAVRSLVPDATSVEKPMELMLLTTVHVARDMPPLDAWFAGHAVSYHYFGFVMVDVMQRLSGVAPSHALNLGFASVIGMGVAATAGLAGDALRAMCVRPAWLRRAGVSAAVIAVWAVIPPIAALHFIHARAGAPATGALPWWAEAAANALPDAQVHYPAFVIALGDLHPHVIGLPLLIMALGVFVSEVIAGTPTGSGWRAWAQEPIPLALTAALFAGVAMTNFWDAMTCGVLWLALSVARCYAGQGAPARLGVVFRIAPAGLVAVAISWPMLAGFDIPPPLITVAHLRMSSLPDLMGLWASFALPLSAAWVVIAPPVRRRWLLAAFQLAALPLAALWFVPILAGHPDIYAVWGITAVTPFALAAGGSALGAAAFTALRHGESRNAIWLAAAAAGISILFCTEAFTLAGGPGLWRANTIFKFGLAAWVLLAFAGALATTRAAQVLIEGRESCTGVLRYGAVVGIGCTGLLWLVSLLYLPAALHTRSDEGQSAGLDSLAYLRDADPGADAAAQWIRQHLSPERHVVVEAVSPSFEYGNALATSTGVPTLIAWPNHERQWRGTLPLIDEREEVVERIYRFGGDSGALLARRYGVTHVYVGIEERSRYGPAVAERFASWPIVFTGGNSRIFTVPDD